MDFKASEEMLCLELPPFPQALWLLDAFSRPEQLRRRSVYGRLLKPSVASLLREPHRVAVLNS